MSCGAITNSSTLQIYHMWSNFQSSTWQIAPHYKQFCHVVQNYLSCEAKLLHMKYFAPQTLSAASATIIMYDHIIIKQIRPNKCYIFEKEGTQGYQIWYSGLSFLSYDDYQIIVWWSACYHMIIIMSSHHHEAEKTQHMLYFRKGGDSRISKCKVFKNLGYIWKFSSQIYALFCWI